MYNKQRGTPKTHNKLKHILFSLNKRILTTPMFKRHKQNNANNTQHKQHNTKHKDNKTNKTNNTGYVSTWTVSLQIRLLAQQTNVNDIHETKQTNQQIIKQHETQH